MEQECASFGVGPSHDVPCSQRALAVDVPWIINACISLSGLWPAWGHGLVSKLLDGQWGWTCLQNWHFWTKHYFPIFFPPIHLIFTSLQLLVQRIPSPLLNEAGLSPHTASPFLQPCQTYEKLQNDAPKVFAAYLHPCCNPEGAHSASTASSWANNESVPLLAKPRH